MLQYTNYNANTQYKCSRSIEYKVLIDTAGNKARTYNFMDRNSLQY